MKNILILSHSDPGKTAGVLAMDVYRSIERLPDHHVELISNLPNTGSIRSAYIRSIRSRSKYGLNHFLVRARRRFDRVIGLDRVQATDPKYCVLQHGLEDKNKMTGKIIKEVQQKPDVILVMFMQGFLTFKNLLELHQEFNCRIMVYLMDMAPLTGGCHYAWDCTRYFDKCGRCPAYFSDTENDRSRINWERKEASIGKTPIELIGGSQWLLDQANKSGLFRGYRSYKLFSPIDPELFTPRSKPDVRRQLGIPIESRIIFFGANSVTEERKGFHLLLDALGWLKNILPDSGENVHLVIAGNGMPGFHLPFNHTDLGHLSHLELAMAFAAADIFLSPSIEDSGPMMVNQSIMVGTPVVAFKTGVALDLIDEGRTGFLAERGNSKEFAEAVFRILTMAESEYGKMRDNCRQMGISSTSIESFGRGFAKCLS